MKDLDTLKFEQGWIASEDGSAFAEPGAASAPAVSRRGLRCCATRVRSGPRPPSAPAKFRARSN